MLQRSSLSLPPSPTPSLSLTTRQVVINLARGQVVYLGEHDWLTPAPLHPSPHRGGDGAHLVHQGGEL